MKFNKEERFIALTLVTVIIGLMFVAYGNYIKKQTIQSAELTTVTENGYSISFEGEEHYYSFS